MRVKMSTNEIFSDPSGTARAYVLLFKARINRLEKILQRIFELSSYQANC